MTTTRPAQDAQAVKRRVDLLALVGRDTTLKKVAATGGGEYAGPCPFCGGDDRFRVQPERGIWMCRKCTGEHTWRDCIAYTMQRHHLTFREALERLGGDAPAPNPPPSRRLSNTPTPTEHAWWTGLEPVAQWVYVDPTSGAPVAIHDRYERPHPKKPGELEKAYPWRRPDGRPTRSGDLHPADLPLYNAPDLLEADADAWVVVCEGEKAADAIADPASTAGLGRRLLAVSPAGGASQRDFGASLVPLAGRRIGLWPDHDEPGAVLMRRVRLALAELRPAPVAVVTLNPAELFPGEAADGQDAYEWLVRDGRGPEDVLVTLERNKHRGSGVPLGASIRSAIAALLGVQP